ncbi:MAG: hypothetical protein HY755_06975 [Nitrospirae bacterium]|nr:hypothetical protein [Nitrospirota bacterium]
MEEQKALGVDFSIASKDVIEALLEEVADPNMFEEILQLNKQRPEILQLLVENYETPEHIKEDAAKLLQIPVKSVQISAKPEAAQNRSTTLLQRVQGLTVSEKRLLAMRGGREARSVLIKDTNKQVVMAVLENPKITESEIEILAHLRSISDEILRAITKNREWMKNYAIMLAITTNPKTPPGIAIPMLGSLKVRDLTTIEKNRNVAEALRTAAKKMAHAKKPH